MIHVRSLAGARTAHQLLWAEHESAGLVPQIRRQRVGQLIRVLQRQTDFLDLWRHLLEEVWIAELRYWGTTHRVHGSGQGEDHGGQQEHCHFTLHGGDDGMFGVFVFWTERLDRKERDKDFCDDDGGE